MVEREEGVTTSLGRLSLSSYIAAPGHSSQFLAEKIRGLGWATATDQRRYHRRQSGRARSFLRALPQGPFSPPKSYACLRTRDLDSSACMSRDCSLSHERESRRRFAQAGRQRRSRGQGVARTRRAPSKDSKLYPSSLRGRSLRERAKQQFIPPAELATRRFSKDGGMNGPQQGGADRTRARPRLLRSRQVDPNSHHDEPRTNFPTKSGRDTPSDDSNDRTIRSEQR